MFGGGGWGGGGVGGGGGGVLCLTLCIQVSFYIFSRKSVSVSNITGKG